MSASNILSKSAQRVQDALSQHGLSYRVIELAASTRTAIEAANAIGCQPAQIIKSLVFCTTESGTPILILASGINRVNEKQVKTAVGSPIIKAEADFIKTITGFAIGGIPPVGHQQALETFIDEDLLCYDELWAAAGTPNAVFNLRPEDLVTMTNGKIIKIT